jgi:uncharacterized protein YgbK (DUF1537 family)
MVQLLILADDLTGALDTGIQFVRGGVPARVFPSPEPPGRGPGGEEPPVLVINTGSRHLSPGEARRLIEAALHAAPEAEYVYKKTDSTLRGHTGAELEALMAARNTRRLPFVPAYPELGRITRGGVQYLQGVPVHETGMGRDPLDPVRTSFIPELIAGESEIPVRLILPGGALPPAPAEREILLFDGQTPEDLRETARRLFAAGFLRESAGCAGFAGALQEVLPLSPPSGAGEPLPEGGPLLLVSGSLHEVSREQVRRAREGGLRTFAPGEGELLSEDWLRGPGAEALAGEASAALREGGIALLGTARSLGEASGGEVPGEAARAAGGLGALAALICREAGPLSLGVFGGDTLLGIAQALGIDYIEPREEVLSGIVLSRAAGPGGSFPLITKAGAFGPPELIGILRERFCPRQGPGKE